MAHTYLLVLLPHSFERGSFTRRPPITHKVYSRLISQTCTQGCFCRYYCHYKKWREFYNSKDVMAWWSQCRKTINTIEKNLTRARAPDQRIGDLIWDVGQVVLGYQSYNPFHLPLPPPFEKEVVVKIPMKVLVTDHLLFIPKWYKHGFGFAEFQPVSDKREEDDRDCCRR